MIIKKMVSKHNLDRWKVYFGPDENSLTEITVFSKNFKGGVFNKPNPYIIHEPLFLQDLSPNQFEYKYFLDGYITRLRKFTKYDMAVDSLKTYYRKMLNILARDPDINPWSLDEDEFKYIQDNLPDNNMSKFILKKLTHIST